MLAVRLLTAVVIVVVVTLCRWLSGPSAVGKDRSALSAGSRGTGRMILVLFDPRKWRSYNSSKTRRLLTQWRSHTSQRTWIFSVKMFVTGCRKFWNEAGGFWLSQMLATSWRIPAATNQFELYVLWMTSNNPTLKWMSHVIRPRIPLSKISSSLAPRGFALPQLPYCLHSGIYYIFYHFLVSYWGRCDVMRIVKLQLLFHSSA